MNNALPLRLPRPVSLLAAGLFMALILFTSTQPSPQIHNVKHQSLVDHALDYAHFPIYALLTCLLMLSLGSFDICRQIAAFVIAAGFGMFNEYVQMNTPGRSSSLKDIIVNILGALFTVACVNYFLKKSPSAKIF